MRETSVADPGCLSRIPDPDFYPSRIPDLGSRTQKQQQKTGVKKIVVMPFYVATNFTNLKKTYSGSRIRIQGSKIHRIPDPEHCEKQKYASNLRHHVHVAKVTFLLGNGKISSRKSSQVLIICRKSVIFSDVETELETELEQEPYKQKLFD
jgi:hypothetical protein